MKPIPMQWRTAIDFHTIKPVSPYSRGGVMIVIDGKPYCRVDDIHTARNAVVAWARNWPAIAGKKVEILG